MQRAHQQLTHQWWAEQRSYYDLVASPLVAQEASRGNLALAQQRLDALRGVVLLDITEPAAVLAKRLIQGGPLPEKAQADALHIALAAVHGIEYLLTWNCTHIANAHMRPHVEAICRASGYAPPVLCTPEELTQEEDHVERSNR